MEIVLMSEVDETLAPEWLMDGNDRCDSCQAQAYYCCKFAEGVLHFCRHHFLKYEDNLRKTTYEIIDESSKLEPQEVLDHA